MFAEFAVEPAAMVTSIDRFTGMIDRFGIDQGRIISDFAEGRWSAAVIQQAEATGLREVALASVVERLREMRDTKGIAKLRQYPRIDGGWTANALHADNQLAFHGLITEAGNCGHARECGAANARSDQAPLRVDDFADIPRTAAAIAGIADPLIRVSRKLHLSDPHIGFAPRWLNPLRALIAACRAPMEVTVHAYATGDGKPTPEYFEGRVRHYFQTLPAGVGVSFQRWTRRPGGQEFHDRAILSDVGGMTFGNGLDEGDAGTTVHVHRLGRAGWQALLAKFTPETSPYEAETPIVLQQAGAP
jgi:hypothetical protein